MSRERMQNADAAYEQEQVSRLASDFRSGLLSRRALIAKAGGLGISLSGMSLLLAACGSNSPSSGSGSSASSTSSAAGGSSSGASGTISGSGKMLQVNGLNPAGKKKPADMVVKMQPFIENSAYHRATSVGGKQAAKDLGVGSFDWSGPATVDASAQVAQLDTWITQKVDAMAVSIGDPAAMAPAIDRAVEAGIPVTTYDQDSPESKRYVFNNPVDPNVTGKALMDLMAKQIGGSGEIAVLNGSPTAPQQQLYGAAIKAQAAKYPKIKIVSTQYTNSIVSTAVNDAKALMSAHPALKGIIAPDGAAFPGASQAVQQAGKAGKIKVTGLTDPESEAPYMKGANPVCDGFYLWNAVALGYRAVWTAVMLYQGHPLKTGEEVPTSTTRRSAITVTRSPTNASAGVVTLGPPQYFTPATVGKYKF